MIDGDNIRMLLLENNVIDGWIPPAIGNLPMLVMLSLESTNFSPKICRGRSIGSSC
jgi:hypothetical protein